MCHLASWVTIETKQGSKQFFITEKDTRTKTGKELRDYLGDRYEEDIIGHGAIDFYFELKGKGKHEECTDFSPYHPRRYGWKAPWRD